MHRWNCNRRLRGQATLIALLLVTILLYAGLAQMQLTLVVSKAGAARARNLAKDTVLINAVHHVRLQAPDEEGEMDFEEVDIAYRQLYERQLELGLDLVEVRFEDHPGWPVAVGFWLQGKRFDIFLRDFRAGGGS